MNSTFDDSTTLVPLDASPTAAPPAVRVTGQVASGGSETGTATGALLASAASATTSTGAPPATAVPALRQVLHVINGEHYSGAERVQDLLGAALPKLGYAVSFASVKTDRFPEARAHQQVPLHDVAMHGRIDLRVVRQVAHLIEQLGSDLVHAHTPRSALVASIAAWWTGRPFVYHVHSPTARDSTRRWVNRVNQWTEQMAVKRADALVTVSESLAAEMRRQGFRPEKIHVVANGVPGSQRRATPPSDDRWMLGTVALFRPRKGTEVLLEAVAKLRRQGRDVRLLAVGGFETDAYRDELLALAKQRGITEAVRWRGFTRDVSAELEQMHLFVLPSLFGEGMPMVVLEALAVGLPVVATHVEGVPEVIRDGLDGRLVRPRDAEDLADALLSVMDGDLSWQHLHDNALSRHADAFSDRSMAAGLANVYDQLLSRAPVAGQTPSGN